MSPASKKMDSTVSVNSSATASAAAGVNNINSNNSSSKSNNSKKGNNRRGSNPSNFNNSHVGDESGITSPRGEAVVVEQQLINPATIVTGKRRPSISSAPPRPTRPQNSANIPSTSASTDTTKNVSLFAHLPQVSTNTTSPTASITAQLLKSGKETSIHPAIIKLGLAFADYSVMGAAERCRQMLLAFKQVSEFVITWCSYLFFLLGI
jgi:hypothetical protein